MTDPHAIVPVPASELQRLRDSHAALLEALQALIDGRPTEEPPSIAKIAHRNWELFEQARAAIDAARKVQA